MRVMGQCELVVPLLLRLVAAFLFTPWLERGRRRGSRRAEKRDPVTQLCEAQLLAVWVAGVCKCRLSVGAGQE